MAHKLPKQLRVKTGEDMDLQKSIIADFKQTYPEVTLKKASELLGIQITRVFRLLNGHEMKLKEYEKFQSLLGQTKYQDQLNLNGYGVEEKNEIEMFANVIGRWSQYRRFC